MQFLKSFFQFIDNKRLLNLIFMLSFLFNNYYVFLICYIMWAVYLIYKFIKTSYKIEKCIYFSTAILVIVIVLRSLR